MERSSLGWAAALLVAQAAAAAAAGGPLAPPPRAALARPPAQRGCDVSAAHLASPAAVALSGRATVTLTLQTDCSAVGVPAHVSLVFDNSVAMGGVRMNYMKQAVAAFTGELDFSVARVALVAYSQSAEILAPLSTDPVAVNAAAQRFFPRLGSDLRMGLRAARQALVQGRHLAAVENPEEVIILLVGSRNDGGPEEALAEAQLAKDMGMTVITIAAGVDSDPETLEQMATSSSLFYSEGTGSRWPSLFVALARRQGTLNVTGALVTDVLPAELGYVFGSGFPAPRIRDQELSWQFGIWPEEGLLIEFQVEARQLGRHPLTRGAYADLILDRGLPQRVVFPAGELEVVPGPSATPVPATATPTPSPTVATLKAYLPLTSRGECLARGPPLELVVVVDTSMSMMTALPGGGVRLDRAMEAAARLLDALRFPSDSGAVVAVAAAPAVLARPSTDRATVISALGRVYGQVADGSRLDRGIRAAATIAADPARRRLIVAFTDGADDVPAVAAAAESARRGGASVIGLAFGPGAGPGAAEAMFSPAGARWAATAGDLAPLVERALRTARCGAPFGD